MTASWRFVVMLLALGFLSGPGSRTFDSTARAAEESVYGKSFDLALTGAGDPSGSTDGVSLLGGVGYTVSVAVESTRTITGGSVTCWYYGASVVTNGQPTMTWMKCPTSLDCTPRTGARYAACGDVETPTGFGRIKYIPNLTASGGTNAVITIMVRARS